MSQDGNLWNRPDPGRASEDTSVRPPLDCVQCAQCGTYVVSGTKCDCTPDSAILQLVETAAESPPPQPSGIHDVFSRPKEAPMAKRKPRRKPRY